eukprot:456573-Pelagomonas_calceolata.AAC.1
MSAVSSKVRRMCMTSSPIMAQAYFLSQKLKLLEELTRHNGLTVFYEAIPGGTAPTTNLAQFSVSRKVLPLPPKPP